MSLFGGQKVTKKAANAENTTPAFDRPPIKLRYYCSTKRRNPDDDALLQEPKI